MKKSEIFFATILVPIDYGLLVLAGISAYFLRYSDLYQQQIREVVFSLEFGQYLQYIFIIAAIWISIFAVSGLFSMHPRGSIFGLLNKVFLACSTGTLLVIVLFFFSRELFSSRFIILAGWVISIIYISIAHLLGRYIEQLLYLRDMGTHRVVLVGSDIISDEIFNEFSRNPKLGYKVVAKAPCYSGQLEIELRQLASTGSVDEIIQTDPNMSREQTLKLIDLANQFHLEFKYTADLLGARRSNFNITTIKGIPIIEIKKTPLDGWGRVAKRIFDIIGSVLALIIFSPFFIILPIMIKIDSKGPAFYSTKRIGAKGKKFNLYKFRSMISGADRMKAELVSKNERSDGPLFKIKNDPRITKIGGFIRRYSLDEIPNFWNVLIGNMSLVGPRPHEPSEVKRYQKHHRKLLNIKPGITGMAQVSGRSTLDFETEVKLDILYIETWSLKLDIIILLKTPIVVLFSSTAA